MTVRKRLFFLVCVSVFFLATSVLFTEKWIRNTFGAIPVEQIAFHLVNPLDGVDPAFVYDAGRVVAGAAALSALYAAFLFRALRGKGVWRVGGGGMCRLLGCAALLMCCFSIGYTQYQYGILTFLNPTRYLMSGESTFFTENYRRVAGDVTFPGRKNNLVLLVLESAESTFNREELFGEKLMPALDRVARNNISFSRGVQCAGTEWSVAGICNYFLGVPLLLNYNKIYERFSSTFLPGAESILRVLTDNGYSVDFMIGVNSRFAGHHKVILTHAPDARIVDGTSFANERGDYTANLSDWGAYDNYLFERAKEFLSNRDRKQPFALVVETMNTHAPGYPHPDNPRRWNDYRDCFPELDGNVEKFLTWLDGQDFAGDTTVVLLGDHLAMTETMGAVALPPRAERTVYNAFVNSRRHPGTPGRERLFASWDMAPTILESVGAELPGRRFGLGVSLFSDEATLLEKYGIERYERERQNPSSLYSSLYSRK